jgi:putative FmdB family regulatory protein
VPTYEYACTACGHRLEAVQRFSDDPLTECPECGGELRKVYAPVGIVLKGSGFYKTDSRAAASSNGSSKKGAETKADGDASPSKGSESSSSPSSGSEGSKPDSKPKESAPAASSAG